MSNSLDYSLMDPTDEAVFTAGLDDVTTMSKVLHELHQAEDHSVLVITAEGIRLITAGEKTFQVSAFFDASTFQRFKFSEVDQVNFRFVTRDLVEALNLLREDEEDQQADIIKTSLYIQYRKRGDPLRLRLENKSNYVINVDLKAFNHGSMMQPLAIQDGEETAVIVMNSKRLYEYVSGLDLIMSDVISLFMGRGDTPIKFCTKSTLLGEVELEITQNERAIIQKEIEVSDNCFFSFSYKTQFMRPALEALKTSSVVQIKCGSSGLLCIQHFLERSSVEYFILCEAKPVEI